jgi:hypothetical protein
LITLVLIPTVYVIVAGWQDKFYAYMDTRKEVSKASESALEA